MEEQPKTTNELIEHIEHASDIQVDEHGGMAVIVSFHEPVESAWFSEWIISHVFQEGVVRVGIVEEVGQLDDRTVQLRTRGSQILECDQSYGIGSVSFGKNE